MIDHLQQAIYNSLDDLGNTAYEVADSLRKHNIRGYRTKTDSCPLACYLDKEFPYKFSVELTEFSWDLGQQIKLPQACQDFVREFDLAEQFSDLAIEE